MYIEHEQKILLRDMYHRNFILHAREGGGGKFLKILLNCITV
jgi:hypothetical protein